MEKQWGNAPVRIHGLLTQCLPKFNGRAYVITDQTLIKFGHLLLGSDGQPIAFKRFLPILQSHEDKHQSSCFTRSAFIVKPAIEDTVRLINFTITYDPLLHGRLTPGFTEYVHNGHLFYELILNLTLAPRGCTPYAKERDCDLRI